MPDDQNKPISDEDAELLRRIREDFRYCMDYWRENREEAATDMKFLAGDAWDDEARKEREDNGRLCLTPDELSQYTKQANNNFRQNPIGIKIAPAGPETSNGDADLRSAYIRGIEYRSTAEAAYTTGFEQAVDSGLGGWRINLDYVDSKGYEVEPRIRRIPNQFTILPDPDAKEADFSDMDKFFLIDTMRVEDFKRKYPNARIKSFATGDVTFGEDWFKGKNIVIAEAWYRESKKRKKLQFNTEAGDVELYEDELPKGDTRKPVNERTFEEKKVVQYITNGFEILERNNWIGSRIPFPIVTGEEKYTNDSGESKRVIFSLIRRARVPQQMLAFIASNEAEEFGMAPRAPLMLWEGMEQADLAALTSLNKVPQAFVKLKPVMTDKGEALPPPERLPFTPNAQAYEISRESWRRAIQAAIGVTPLPTAAQRQNEKSGVALEKIQTQEAIGSFHFTANFKRAIHNTGWQINELIDLTNTKGRHVGTRTADGKHDTAFITPDEKYVPQGYEGKVLVTGRGDYDVTIEAGPSYLSQREEAANFADTLLGELQALAPLLPPGAAAQLLAMAVKLREIGPIGEQIVKIIEGDPNSQQQQAAQAMAQLNQQKQLMAEMQQELQKLQMEKQGKVIEHEYKLKIANLEYQFKVAQLDNQRAIAEIETKAQDQNERKSELHEVEMELHGSAHELALQKDQQAHDSNMADKNAVIAQNAATQQAALNPPSSAGPA